MDKDFCFIEAHEWKEKNASCAASFPDQIRLLTWNLLAPCYKRTSYGRESERKDDWSIRQQMSLQKLLQHRADVVFLQEVWFESHYFEGLCHTLSSVYHVLYCQRVHGKQDGLSILLRKDVIPSPTTYIGVDFYDFGSRIALVVEWDDVVMMNTHLTFPHNNKYDRLLRLSQVQDIIHVLDRYAGKKIVLAGDCNGSIFDEAVQKIITELALIPMLPHGNFCSHISHRGDEMACDLLFSSPNPCMDVVIHPIIHELSDHACVEATFHVGNMSS